MIDIEKSYLIDEINRLKAKIDKEDLQLRALSYFHGWATSVLEHISTDYGIEKEALSFNHNKYSDVINEMFHLEEKREDESVNDDILELFYKS